MGGVTQSHAEDLDAARADARAYVRLHRELCTARVSSALLFERASGCRIHDAEGRDYLDLLSGFGAASTGWNHPRVLARARAPAERGLFAPPVLSTRHAAELAHALLEVMALPDGWRCVRAAGGADANEQALKAACAMARATGRRGACRFVRFERSYHGGTLATLALSDVEAFALTSAPALVDHPRLPLPRGPGDVAPIDDLLERDRTIAGVILEPVLGSGGVFPIPGAALRALRDACTRRRVTLIFDEVMTGCGRVGAMLAAHLADVEPDAITLGKGLSAGAAPIGAALLSPALSEVAAREEDTTSTFAWTPLACAVAHENLRVLDEEHLAARAALRGEELRRALSRELSAVFGARAEVRAVGLMLGVSVRSPDSGAYDAGIVRRLVVRCLREGVMVGASWEWRHLLLLPPLVITPEECAEGVEKIARAAATIER